MCPQGHGGSSPPSDTQLSDVSTVQSVSLATPGQTDMRDACGDLGDRLVTLPGDCGHVTPKLHGNGLGRRLILASEARTSQARSQLDPGAVPAAHTESAAHISSWGGLTDSRRGLAAVALVE